MIGNNTLIKRQNLLLVLIVLFPIFIVNLGGSSLWDLDEGVYAEMAREMVLRDDYINTFFNFAPRFDKPPLVLWLTAFFYKIFGVSEFSTRFGVMLFGMGTLILVYIMGKEFFNKKTGLIATLVLGTSFQFVIQSRMIYMDVPLTFFIMLSLYLFWLGFNRDRKYYLLMGVSLALGTLVKGPVALGLPGLIVLFYLGILPFLREFKHIWTWGGAIIYFIIALPWHLLIWNNYGSRFLNDYFGYHMLTRFSKAIETHSGPWYYYIGVIILGLLPWSAFIPWGVGLVRKNWQEKRQEFRLLLIWFAVIFIFFSIASTKLPGYILPTYPILALLVGYWWDRVEQGSVPRRKLILSSLLILISGLLVLTAFYYISPRVEREFPQYLEAFNTLFYFPWLFIFGSIIALVLILKTEKSGQAFTVFFVVSYISLLVLILLVIPAVDAFKPIRPLAGEIAEVEGVKVVNALEMRGASTVFYSKKKVEYITKLDGVIKYIEDNPRVYILLDRDDYKYLLNINNKKIKLYLHKEHGEAVLVSNFKEE